VAQTPCLRVRGTFLSRVSRTGDGKVTGTRRLESLHYNKNAFLPAKRRMKAFNEPGRKIVRPAGLILLFDGEVGRRTTVIDRRDSDRDEHSQTGILTSASNRLPAFPSRSAEQWLWEFVAVTVAQPSRIFTGFPDV